MLQQVCRVINLGRRDYQTVWELQRQLAVERRRGGREDCLLLVEHDPVLTIGRAGSRKHIKVPEQVLQGLGIAVLEVDRGGDITYHGPGQAVGYPILNLALYGRDLHQYVRLLEQVVIQTIAVYGIEGFRIPGLTGVWTQKGKIAAIGIGVKGWVSLHGFSLNVHPDMNCFRLIHPCGLIDRPVTCLANFGVDAGLSAVFAELQRQFAAVFAVTMTEQQGGSKNDGSKTGMVEN